MAPLTTFTIDDAGNLRIALTDSGRDAWDEIRAERDTHGINSAFLLLIENQLCNGWEAVRAEEVGALTDSLILTDEATRDDNGELTSVGRVFWNPRYQVDDEIESMETDGFVTYELAK